MGAKDLGKVDIEDLGEGVWFVWNLKYGRHTDSGDMGFIQQSGEEYEAFSRGDLPRSLGKRQTLSDAVAVLRADY